MDERPPRAEPLRGLGLVVAGLAAVALATHAPDADAPAPPAPSSAVEAPLPLAEAGPPSVDLNRAGADELSWLPGIGPALSARIVEDRRAHGPYDRIETLARVRGIGPRTVERLRPYVTIDRTAIRSESTR